LKYDCKKTDGLESFLNFSLQREIAWLTYTEQNNPGGNQVEDFKKNVEMALDKIRPFLQRDGGDIELVEIIDGIVKVRLTGACKGCPMSQMTLKQGVERALMKEVPGLKEVQAVN
jgi:Fe-S cluster biogenesis protein NfuA